MHRWQSGLPKVDHKDSPLSSAEGLILRMNEPQRHNVASATHKGKNESFFVSSVSLWFKFFSSLFDD